MSVKDDAGGVPIGGYRVQVASVIDPGAFWVVDHAGPDSGRIKVLELEKRLAAAVRTDERITTDVNHWVCIRNPNTGAWHRGLVNNIIQLGDKYIYVVFLVDHGTCLQVEVDHLAQLSKAFLRPTFQAFEVVLDGLRPTVEEDCGDHGGSTPPRWPREALVYVSQLLDTVLYTHFVPVGLVANKIYGELYLQRGGDRCLSLSSLLCRRGYATKAHSSVPAPAPPPDVAPGNETKTVENSPGNFVNDVEIDDGYISNYYIRKDKENLKPCRKMSEVFGNPAMREPEFASMVKQKVPAADMVVVPLEVCGASTRALGSGGLLQSVRELMQREDTLAGGRSTFLCAQQSVSLRPASDTRGAVDKNAAAMYKSAAPADTAAYCKETSPVSRAEGSVTVEEEHPLPNVERQGIDLEGCGDWSVEVSSTGERDEPVKDEALAGDKGVDSRSDGLIRSGEATLGNMTDALRSRLDTSELLRETLDMTRVLCHSHEPLQPFTSLREASFPMQIHKAMERLNFKSAFNIQLYAWAAVLEHRSTFLVSPACSGKTLSYVLPLLSKCVSGTEFQQVRPGSAPNILVLCPGYETARFVYYVCAKVLQLASICHVDIVLTHGGGAETEVMTQLLNGCHILVSTPRCWLRLYQCSELLANLSRLSYLVLEDADVLISKFPEVKEIVQMCKKVSSVQSRDIALICVSETWTKHIRGLAAGLSENACVCFGSCLEAAVYANLQPNLYFIDAADKDKKVIRTVVASYSLQRTVVVCLTAPQVLHLTEVLQEAGLKVLGAHELLPSYDLDEVRSRWLQSRRGNFPVLVCSDDVLLEMKVMDASILVHYSLPASSKTQFGFRFSCLMDNFQSIFGSPDVLYLECAVHVLVDSADVQQFPTLINLVRRLGGVLSAEVQAKYQDVLDAREKQKIDSPLCQNLKAFGWCWNKLKCPGRHFFNQSVDEDTDLPREGQVKMKVVHVHSANWLSVRLLEHCSSTDNCWSKLSDHYLDIAFKLQQHFQHLDNRVQVAHPEVGKVYAVSSGGYHRAICEQVEKNDVVVRFMDEGAVKTFKSYNLMPVPEELQQIPAQAVEVILCGLAPHDDDTAWSMLATQATFDWVSDTADSEDVGVYVAGKVVLSLGGTLWLSPLMARQYLADINTDIFVSSLRKHLLQGGYAVPSPDHTDKLYQLCQQASISISGGVQACAEEDVSCAAGGAQVAGGAEVAADVGVNQPLQGDGGGDAEVVEPGPVSAPVKDNHRPRWESLPTNEPCPVILSLVSPGEFYVQKTGNTDQIEQLTDELQDYLASSCEAVTTPQPGLYCAGRWPADNRWYRAKVIQLFEDGLLELFSVDLGDFTTVSCKDIAVLPQCFVDKLPFQAIECELAAVRPLHGAAWEESINEEFYALASEEYDWTVEVVGRSESSGATVGSKYSVELRGVSECGCVDVNQELVNLGLAVSTADAHGEDCQFDVQFTDQEVADLFRSNTSRVASPPPPSRKLVELDEAGDFRLEAGANTGPEEIAPALASHAKTPYLSWYQSTHLVCLEIKVPGTERYCARCTRTYLDFRAVVSGDLYYVGLALCGVVEPEESNCAEVVGGVRIKLRKQCAVLKWPHLAIPRRDTVKASWSVDHIDEPEQTHPYKLPPGLVPRGGGSDDNDKEREFLSESEESGDESAPFY